MEEPGSSGATLMRNSVQLDEKHNAAIRTAIAEHLSYLLKREASQAAWVDQIREQEALVARYRVMEQETTDASSPIWKQI